MTIRIWIFIIFGHRHQAQLKLLSELDIICILINSYFSDGEHRFEKHKSISSLKEYFDSIQENNKTSNDSISKEDFWEIEEYLKENFSSSNYANNLISFLEVISDRAVETDVLSKAQFYAPFWGFREHQSIKIPYPPDRLCPRRRRPSCGICTSCRCRSCLQCRGVRLKHTHLKNILVV